MRKLVATVLSLAFFTTILAGCGASSPNSAVWSPRDVGEARSPSTPLAR